MRSLKIGKFKEKFYTPGQTIKQHDNERRKVAQELAKNHTDNKPIRYILKR